MLLPKFEYYAPKTVEHACQIMAELREKASLLAGGTDLLVNMKNRVLAPENLVSLGDLEELTRIVWLDERVEIGSCCKVARLQSEDFQKEYRALKMGADCLGSPLLRNLSTIGGNIVSARPAADLPPSLMVYDGRVVLKSSTEERIVPLSDFFVGVGKTVMKPDEILMRVIVPKAPLHSGSAYIKLGMRKSLEIALVSVAAFIAMDEAGETIANARIAMGSVAPVPLRSASAEKLLMGEKIGESLLAAAAKAASQDSCPIDNFRGSAEYRREMVEVLTGRALQMAVEQAGSC